MEAVLCGLTAMEVADLLSTRNADQVLIVDCRSFMAYNQGRIVQSINIHFPPILKRRSGGFIALENIVPCDKKRAGLLNGSYTVVLVYDDNTPELTQAHGDSNLISVIKSLLKQVEGVNVRYIKGGFEAVQEECPVLCRRQDVPVIHSCRDKLSHKDRRRPSPPSEPAEILPHLYLGDVSHSSQRQLLDQMGITALLNVSSTCGNHFQSHFRYMNVQVNDNMDADLFSWFPKIIEFIDNVAAEDGKVLVHCRAGVSRSATVCIAYIMQKRGLSLDSAFEFVMTRRPVIDPNLNFIQQLQRFETNLKSNTQLSNSSTHTTYSFPQHSDPLPTSLKSTSAFSFSSEDVSENADMDTSSKEDIMSQPDSYHHHQFITLQPIPQNSPSAAADDLNLSPSSISQTAASPSPVWTLGLPASRPGTLPLLQISTPLPRASLLPSPSRSVPYPIAPLLDIFHGPSEAAEAFSGNYTNEPKTPLPPRAFSFFGSDAAACPGIPLPLDISPRQCRPTTPTALDVSSAPYLSSEHTFPSVVAHSPLSPISVPLSPLPSFG